MEELICLVRGRRVDLVAVDELRSLSREYRAVVVDVGTGDGRWLYRLARARPDTFCLGVDANADAMREVSYRSACKPARGGLRNVRFAAADVGSLPSGLREMADEIWISYPWGTLLRAVLAPEPSVLGPVASILKPRGVLRVAINESLLNDAPLLRKIDLAPRTAAHLYDAMRAGYGEAGLNVTSVRSDGAGIRSSWSGRLGQGAGVRTLSVEAAKDGNGRGDGG